MSPAMRDAWLLVGAAVSAERLDEAQILADTAAQLTGWRRFRPLGSCAGVDLWGSELMPRGFAYLSRRDWALNLLIHTDATEFLTETVGWIVVRRRALENPGLIRLDDLLAEMMFASMLAPDSPEGC